MANPKILLERWHRASFYFPTPKIAAHLKLFGTMPIHISQWNICKQRMKLSMLPANPQTDVLTLPKRKRQKAPGPGVEVLIGQPWDHIPPPGMCFGRKAKVEMSSSTENCRQQAPDENLLHTEIRTLTIQLSAPSTLLFTKDSDDFNFYAATGLNLTPELNDIS